MSFDDATKTQEKKSILSRYRNKTVPCKRQDWKPKARRIIQRLAVFAVTAIIGVHVMRAQRDTNNPKLLTSALGSNDGLTLDIRSTAGVQTTFANAQGAGLLSSAPATAPAKLRALTFVTAHGSAFGLKSAADVMLRQESSTDEVGLEHVRFQQLHLGVPVTGGELHVHLRGERVVSANSELVVDPNIDITPALTATDSLIRARELIRRLDPLLPAEPVYSTPRLEVFNRGILEEGTYPTRLTWYIEATARNRRESIWVDSRTGGIVLHFNQFAEALNRRIYSAGGTAAKPGTLIRSEGESEKNDAEVNSAYTYTGDTYRYYLTVHGRDSFNNAGAPLISTVHYCPDFPVCPWPNAAWDGTQMVYGKDYAFADDVTAHEITHAVTAHTAGLFYYMQSGALNESYSDIFGETVDLWNGHGTDTAGVRWLMGEDLPGGAIRNMAHPRRVGDSEWQHDPTSDRGGVHTNSGVPNFAYALMTDGGAYNGRSVTGIGLTAAAKIQYRALTLYLTSGANFLDNYNALQTACRDLIGTSGITASTCDQVRQAAEAVEMNRAIPYNTPIPALCSAGETVRIVFEDNFEASPNRNWSPATLAGSGSWIVPDTGWAKSGIHSAWGEDFATRTDAVLAMTSPVTVPARGRLQFNHAYAFEAEPGKAWDGGVIEYSLDNGSWTDAGNLIIAGDIYDPNARIESTSDNPLGGRFAFVGDSYGYTASQLNLGQFANRSIRFRFRVGTDRAVGNTGWVIDDVQLYGCQSNQPTVTVTPTALSFPPQIIGRASSPQRVTITNTGTVVFPTSISVSPDFRINNGCPSSLAVGASCGIDVQFVPAASGLRTGQLNIGNGAPGVSLTGSGIQPAVTVNPAALSFPAQVIGTASSSKKVTITNNLTTVFTTGISASPEFRINNGCPLSLAVGASCDIDVQFVPTASGLRTGLLYIGYGVTSVMLTGSGVPQQEQVMCYVFDDGYTNMAGPAEAVYISGRSSDKDKACIPDGTANGQCRRWFGRCFGKDSKQPVSFFVFDDGATRASGPTDAIFVNGQNNVCRPDGTGPGTCRKWFGLGSATDGRKATFSVFNDGGTNRSAQSDAVYFPTPLPSAGGACIPDNTAKGTCRRWFGLGELQ